MRTVSIKDIAAYTHLSKSTVSRVITNNGYVSEEKRRIVEDAIRDLNYRPNLLARSLVQNQSRTLGVCVPFLNTPFFTNLMDGIESTAEHLGYDVVICHTRERVSLEEKSLCRMIDRRVDGLLVIPVDPKGGRIGSIIGTTPTVFLVRRPSEMQHISSVTADDYHASRRALECLLQKGHRNIGIIRGPLELSTMRDRWQAAQDVLREYGVSPDGRCIQCADLNFESSHCAAQRLLRETPRPTAICALHYWGCAGVMREVQLLGIRIPEDLSFSSFEIFDDWNDLLPINITSNRYPTRQMGEMSVELLQRIIQDAQHQPEHIQLSLEFRERSSVACLH